MNNNGIYWLASYPKSGNTWTRMVLNNYRLNLDSPLDINKANSKNISSNRNFFDELTGLSSSDMSTKEIRNYQPEVYKELLRLSGEDLYIKVHDAYILNSENRPLFPSNITKGVLYIVRNPLDVVVSYSHHSGVSINQMIDIFHNEKHTLDRQFDRLYNQLPQLIKSWSSNVYSWIESPLPIKIVKYEDMIENSYDTFYDILTFLGFDVEKERLIKAIKFSSFEELKKQEEQKGFGEKPIKSKSFFRSGIIGDYKNTLSKEQIEYIVSKNKYIMKRFGYI